jgi:hypothetical protein
MEVASSESSNECQGQARAKGGLTSLLPATFTKCYHPLMSGVLQLNHLRKLLDDESEVVREAVRQQLTGMRRDLPHFLEHLENPLTPSR